MKTSYCITSLQHDIYWIMAAKGWFSIRINNAQKASIKYTRAVQPVATCRQSPYLHKPAIVIVIVTLFSLWRLAPAALAAPVLIMTSFSLWRHSLLSWPCPALRTYERTYVRSTDTLPRLIYKDVRVQLISYETDFILVQSNTKISPKPKPVSGAFRKSNAAWDRCSLRRQRVRFDLPMPGAVWLPSSQRYVYRRRLIHAPACGRLYNARSPIVSSSPRVDRALQ